MSIIETIPGRVDEYDEMLTGQPIFKHRTEGVGIISPELAIAMSATGPILRASGVAWDLRRAMPYLAYDDVDFDVIVGTVGDAFDRYAVRLNEIRSRARSFANASRRCRSGLPGPGQEVTPPPRARIDESMEALIHHSRSSRGASRSPRRGVHSDRVPPRRARLLSRGGRVEQAVRMHIRAPSFVNSRACRRCCAAVDRGRSSGHLFGGPGHGRGGSLMARLSSDNRTRAEAIVACYPQRRSALIPLCHLGTGTGWLAQRGGDEEIAGLLGAPGRGASTATFYDMLHTEPVAVMSSPSATNIACMLAGAYEVLDHAEASLGISVGQTTADGEFHPRRS